MSKANFSVALSSNGSANTGTNIVISADTGAGHTDRPCAVQVGWKTAIAVGAVTNESTVVFKANVTDANAGDQLKLQSR